jgi:predicted DNA-binding transcriptional regulator AlpA
MSEDITRKKLETLGIEDMMKIYKLSQVSIYRRVSAARAGQIRFPIPISDRKQKLCWSAAEVEAHCQARASPQSPVNVANPRHRAKENREQRESTATVLAKHGIGTPTK